MLHFFGQRQVSELNFQPISVQCPLLKHQHCAGTCNEMVHTRAYMWIVDSRSQTITRTDVPNTNTALRKGKILEKFDMGCRKI